ncbi:hypothetical protein XA68_16777 [Ophiocordyceps unilateralis]|uniref:Uncharacterized protein n=1 Tax=Ophiocordyceps unilateralis TaxID=268505 RepID=A0A2A9P5Y1_OPHUN|nr:hypothetical protein XA68_16777 [Ophiocordyceps unilateralis]
MDRTTSDLAWVLSGEDSFNIYMFHGGTNWGFDNGAVWSGDRSLAVTTSYDYGAPLDESGRPTELYHQIRETIAKHVPAGSIPHVPAVPRLIQTGDIVLKPVLSLFDMLPKQPMIESAAPVPMEHMDQSYGFVLYQHTVEEEAEGILFVGDGPRDRVLVYQNGHRVGIIDGTYSSPGRVRVRLNEGDLLQLLVENLGRVDKGHKFEDQRKGIVGNVTVGTRQTLERWKTYSLPLTKLPRGLSRGDKVVVFHRQSPMFYTGSFRLAENAQPGLGSDMFLSIDKAIKGQVWVNGVNLGRYWAMGPQQSLYLPGCYLNAAGRSNKIVVLELEPEANRPMVAKGLSSREWFNRPDPDSVV